MASVDPRAVSEFGALVQAVLPRAVSEAFGGSTHVAALTPGDAAAFVGEMRDGHHVHLELELTVGRVAPTPLVLVLYCDDGAQVFGLETPDASAFGDPETQLRVLAEFTEAAEALAVSLSREISAVGQPVLLAVAGASLEPPESSPAAALAPLGGAEAVAVRVELARPPAAPITIVLVASADVVVALAGVRASGDGGPTGVSASNRAAYLAEKVAARRAAARDEMAVPVGYASPGGGAYASAPVAHPFTFGQLDAAPAASREERSFEPILDVDLSMRVELGSARMTVEDVLGLSIGSVVELDRLAGEPVDVFINQRLIARGEVVVVEENFGVRITEIVSAQRRSA